MKVYVAQPIQPNGIEILKTIAEVRVNPESRPQMREEFLREIPDVDAVVLPWHTEVMDAEALDIAKNLKVIGRHGVGYENIDLQTATKKGVYVTYTPVHTPTVADTAFGLMLMTARKLSLADRFVKAKGWHVGGEWVAWKFLGFDVHHKTIGIIGLGRIGTGVARRAKGFDMTILYYDIVKNEAVERELGARRVSFEELLRTSDFISVNCNLTAATRGLLSEREFQMMKPTAIIVNTARGPIVDQKALYAALKSGTIGGAGLDVFEEEPLALDDPLLELDNVVLLPHIGSAALEIRQKMADAVCNDVVRVLTGNKPVYLLNHEVMRVRPLKG
jgi:D-3-phosphoglycerate dehydrogenase